MEDRMAAYEQDGTQCDTSKINFTLNECMDLERCDSVDLNTLIRSHVQQQTFSKEEESISRQKIVFQNSLCTNKLYIQPGKQKESNMSTEEYELKIHILEKQRTELFHVNKQWEEQFKRMKESYENKVSELKGMLSLCQSNSEKQGLQKKDKVYRDQEKDKTLQQSFEKAVNKNKSENTRLNSAANKNKSENTRLNSGESNMDHEDLKTQVEVLIQQIQIYEEDFKQERADRERINKEKEELQKINQRLRIQLRMNNKPDYQWYVPGQLPPDVKHKETGSSLKQ